MRKIMSLRLRTVVWLCAVMTLCGLVALTAYRMPVLRRAETKGDSFGMMLIDIADEETADHYHVQEHGVYVLAVREKSPAHLAGIASGDLLLKVNAAHVPDTESFVNMQEAFAPGEAIEMHFRHGASQKNYAVTLVWNEE